MATDDYVTFCAGVRRLTGVDLGSYKRAQMERRIRTYAERRQVPDLAAFLGRLESSPAWLEGFLDRITINVSELYRNPEQYETLRRKVLPQLGGAGTTRVWSAGCSYGAEAYTLACILAEEGFGRYEVVGSDIDRRIVERAQRAWFSAADMRHVPPRVRDTWFRPVDGGFQAQPTLSTKVRFKVEDLLRSTYAAGWDLVLCRNVVIYFTDEARTAVHANLAKALRPGGYLMVGATERVHDPRALRLESTHPFMYRKTS